MNKYLMIYRMSQEMSQSYKPSPDEMQAQLAQWDAWKAKFADAITEMGDGLKPEGRVLGAEDVVRDGPFAEAKEVIGGYSIVTCESYEAAIEIAKECPVRFVPGNTVEIREMAGY